MARRELLTEEERASLFGVPTERAALARHYTLGPDDLDFLAARRGEANRLGAATWMALLRHPGFGLRHDETPPRELIAYLADQLGLSETLFGAYGGRAKTRLEHGWDVAGRLGDQPGPSNCASCRRRTPGTGRDPSRARPHRADWLGRARACSQARAGRRGWRRHSRTGHGPRRLAGSRSHDRNDADRLAPRNRRLPIGAESVGASLASNRVRPVKPFLG